MVVVCGGVSVGEHDHVARRSSELGVEQRLLGRLAAARQADLVRRPRRAASLVFGLPGNPVSAMVTFMLFVRPALLALQGADPARDRDHRRSSTPTTRRSRAAPRRSACALELADDGWHATPTGPQGSHVLTSMLGADALAMIPAERRAVAAGERVEVELLPRA